MPWTNGKNWLVTASCAVLVGSCLLPPVPQPKPAEPWPAAATESRAPARVPTCCADGRLPQTAAPLHYALSLRVDPGKPRFSGLVTIDISVAERTRHLFVHAGDMNIQSVVARAYGRQIRAWVRGDEQAKPYQVMHLELEAEVPKGTLQLEIGYDAPFGDAQYGLFRAAVSGAWYAFTYAEPMGARLVFPSFDEPAYKATFDVRVNVPSGMAAFGNMPEAKRTEIEGGVSFEFATTPPLPTYLVAIAVGAFDVEQGPTEPYPIRLLRPKGTKGDAQRPCELARDVTRALEDYLGDRLRFPKIDLVAVPNSFPVAMENPGLVMFPAPGAAARRGMGERGRAA